MPRKQGQQKNMKFRLVLKHVLASLPLTMLTPALYRLLGQALFALSVSSCGFSQSQEGIEQVLDRRIEDFGAQGQEARTVLEGLGAAYRFPIVVDTDIQGSVTFEVHNATVGTVLDAICQPRGWSYEASDRGYLLVRRFVTRIYPVDYLQMTQVGSSSASVNLSESAGGAIAPGAATGATAPKVT